MHHVISYSFIILCIFLQGGCSHLISTSTFNWWDATHRVHPWMLATLPLKPSPPFLPQESNSGKSRSNGNKRPKRSRWATTWRRSCPAGSRWSTASPTTTRSWMITSGQTEGPRGWAGTEHPSSVPGVCRHLPQPRCQQAWAAPLILELCFYTMSKTLWAAAALVGYTSEAVRPEISSTFTFNDCSEGRIK